MHSSHDQQILDLLEARAAAIRNKDADGVIAPYASDVIHVISLPP